MIPAYDLVDARSYEPVPRSLRLASDPVPTEARPCIILALLDQGRRPASLKRAAALARVLDADLHVLVVLPSRPRTRALLASPDGATDAVVAVDPTLLANESTRGWIRDTIGDDAGIDHVTVVRGAFVRQVVAYAMGTDAALIVVSPHGDRLGRTVTLLACSAGVPVLVAREATSEDTIVAATDLRSADFPVLRAAAELGQQLDARLVTVHNVSPVAMVVGIDEAWPMALRPGDLVRGDLVRVERSDRLVRVCGRLPVLAHPVVRTEVDPVAAILGEARAHDADLVVVGARRYDWLSWMVDGSVAAQVVDRAQRSVLVTPLVDALDS